jgi:hypothetical protein
MNLPDLPLLSIIAAVLLGLAALGLIALRSRNAKAGRSSRRSSASSQDKLDTVLSWRPEAVRVMTASETKAYSLLKRALPGFLVLAQVPMARFLRVPMRNSYGEWLQRVGYQNVDLLLCDASSRVLAVIDVRSGKESPRSRERHERMVRVLRAAGITVHVWLEDDLPSVQDVRALFGAVLGAASPEATTADASAGGTPRRASPAAAAHEPLIPVADISEVLAEGDRAAGQHDAMEPVPSGFFDEIDPPREGGRLH